MRNALLPYRYKQQLHAKWLRLKKENMAVDQYIKVFYNLVPRDEVSDSTEKLTACYILGLCSDIHEKLNGFYFTSLDQVVPKAEEFEELLSKVSRRTPLFPEPPTASPLPTKPMSRSSSHTTSHLDSQVHTSKGSKSNSCTSSKFTFVCYNDRKPDHVVAKCPNSKNTLMTIVVDDVIDEDGIFAEDSPVFEELADD